MSSFNLNKIMMAVLLTALVMIGIGGLTEAVFDQEALEKNAYPIEVETASVAAPTAPTAVVEEEPSLAELLAVASVEKGQTVFKKCKACHTSDKGGKNLIGPNLWNVVNRAKGSMDGYAYSDGMKAKGGNWTYEDLSAFLEKPKNFVAKTKMGFAGLKKAGERAALLALLRTFSDAPPALPAVEASGAEAEAPAE